MKSPCVYTKEELHRELRQAEIISNLAQHLYDPATKDVNALIHSYAIIATQDCDLFWDYESTNKRDLPDLNGVLLYEAQPADHVKTKIRGSDIWKRIVQNRDERYHFLESIQADDDCSGEGIPG